MYIDTAYTPDSYLPRDLVGSLRDFVKSTVITVRYRRDHMAVRVMRYGLPTRLIFAEVNKINKKNREAEFDAFWENIAAEYQKILRGEPRHRDEKVHLYLSKDMELHLYKTDSGVFLACTTISTKADGVYFKNIVLAEKYEGKPVPLFVDLIKFVVGYYKYNV